MKAETAPTITRPDVEPIIEPKPARPDTEPKKEPKPGIDPFIDPKKVPSIEPSKN